MATKPNMTRVWAAGAPAGNIEDPDVTSAGKFDDGWLAEIPPFENFNFLQQLFTQGLAYLNEQGLGVYDAITDYPIGGITKGSDGNLYSALVINGPATSVVDPVGDTTATWKPTALLEQLLSSALTHDIASDADYTLSVAENYNGRIVITDTGVLLTAARNIIVADTERSFFVQNDTLEDLTFKTAAGTGIAVGAGNKKLILCDGTDVIDTISGLSSATTTNEGIVELATDSETLAGTDTSRVPSIATLAAHWGTAKILVNFDTNGTTMRMNKNVTSITDNAGNGDSTINFPSLGTPNLVAIGMAGDAVGAETTFQTNAAPTSTAFRLQLKNAAGTVTDRIYCMVAIFADSTQ